MSGIFKSIKKGFKKVGKIVKKIAPVLIIAAAVYFGGAYLMSMGAASSAAPASVAGSFTKSAGVWKSFLGGLANGTASSSAAAYAEASYMATAAEMPLSAQVVAGTNAVQSLGVVHNVETAVSVGFSSAETYQTAILGNASKEVALSQAQEIVTQYSASVGQTTQPAFTVSTATNAAQTATGGSTVPADVHVKTGEQIGINKTSSTFTPPSGTIAPSTDYSAGSNSLLEPKTFADQMAKLTYESNLAEGAARQEQIMAMLDKNHQRNMYGLYMQGAGMLMSAYGASQPSEQEKENKRRMDWQLPEDSRQVVMTPVGAPKPDSLLPELIQSDGLIT